MGAGELRLSEDVSDPRQQALIYFASARNELHPSATSIEHHGADWR